MASFWRYVRFIGVTMFRTRARFIKILFFLVLFVLIDWAIEWTSLRPKSFTATVDSISLATGLASQLVEDLTIALAAFLLLQVILTLTNSLRFLTGEPKRHVRLPDSYLREKGPAGE